MKKYLLLVLLAFTTPSWSDSDSGAWSADNFSATVTLSSNYLYRGLTVSDDHPAISGSFDWWYNGFFAGVWASSLDSVETESIEIDYYAGYGGQLYGFDYGLIVLYYDYPGEAKTGEPEDIGKLAFWEYGVSLAYTFEQSLSPTLGVSLMHAPDYYAESGEATAIEGTLDFTLPYEFGLSFIYGNQNFDEKYHGIDDYRYYGVSLAKSIAMIDFVIGYSGTDDDGEYYQESATDEVYLTMSSTF